MEWILFLHRFIRAPRLIGSLAPSSQHLAQTIVNAIPWDRCRTSVELGAGTGGITRAIQARMRPGSELHIFETDPVFRNGLAKQFPAAVLHEDARELSESIGRARADAIISGLPFTLMNGDQREVILGEVCSTLSPEGVFVAFQYTPHLWSLLRQYFRRVRVKLSPLNFPPAIVYVCSDPIPVSRPASTSSPAGTRPPSMPSFRRVR